MSAWVAPAASTNAFVILHQKLTKMALALKRWNSRNTIQQQLALNVGNELIYHLVKTRDSRQLTREEQRLRNLLKMWCRGTIKMEATG